MTELSLSSVVQAQIEIDKYIRANGLPDLVGSLGEQLAQIVIGGKLMPPAFKGFDIQHERYGRVQVKTRKLNYAANGSLGTETRAVLSTYSPGDFDHLVHIVLDGEYRVRRAILVRAEEVFLSIRGNSGKININQTASLGGAIDMTEEFRKALDEFLS